MNIALMTDELILAAVAVFILLIDFTTDKKKLIGWFFNISMLALLVFVVINRKDGVLFNGAFVQDGLAWYSKIVFLSGALLVGLLSIDTIKVKDKYIGAYYMMLAASTLGMMFLASSKELVTLYVSLELATISLIALTAIYKSDDYSLEGGIKYLILGAVSSGILLYGLSLIYGSTSTTYLDGILAATAANGYSSVFILGLIMVILGVGFKLSMVPMHVWTPDVYQGAPTPITAFISVASKAAGFVLAIRLFSYAFISLDFAWVPILAVLAFLTMTIANLIAIPQKNVKRLLAYSSISQAGYILVGFVGASVIGVSSVMFYMLAYTFTNIAAFAVVAVVAKSIGSEELEDYSGLARSNPVLALTMMIALLSLAGIPPMAGFIGKVYLFYAAMEKGYLWLVIAGALNSTVSLYYYMLVLKRMYIWEKKEGFPEIKVPFMAKFVMIITVAAMLILGIFPGPIIDVTTDIALKLFM